MCRRGGVVRGAIAWMSSPGERGPRPILRGLGVNDSERPVRNRKRGREHAFTDQNMTLGDTLEAFTHWVYKRHPKTLVLIRLL